LVGPFKSRSAAAPGTRIPKNIICTKISPIVLTLAERALAAMSDRVMPIASSFW
jgi:hypothetical protein